MAKICIVDSMGNKICYENPNGSGSHKTYKIRYYESDQEPVLLEERALPDGWTYLDMLWRLAKVARKSDCKSKFDDWKEVTRASVMAGV